MKLKPWLAVGVAALGLAMSSAVMSGAVMSGAALAAPADGPKRMDKVDFAKFSCADALALKQSDPARYGEAAQWLAGWLAEPKVALSVSFPAISEAGERWAADCAAQPAALLRDVAKRVEGKKDAVGLAGFRCQEFLELDAADPKSALALIRWLDGWNAQALRESNANFYYHKKHLQSATDGCMKYPRNILVKVVAGKYR